MVPIPNVEWKTACARGRPGRLYGIDCRRSEKNAPDSYEETVLKRLASQPASTMPLIEWIDGGRLLSTLMPSDYTEDCLACQEDPKGILDSSGYPKEGDRVGGLAGVISIQIPSDHRYQAARADGGERRGDLLPMIFEKLSSTPQSVVAVLAHSPSLSRPYGPALPPLPT